MNFQLLSALMSNSWWFQKRLVKKYRGIISTFGWLLVSYVTFWAVLVQQLFVFTWGWTRSRWSWLCWTMEFIPSDCIRILLPRFFYSSYYYNSYVFITCYIIVINKLFLLILTEREIYHFIILFHDSNQD